MKAKTIVIISYAYLRSETWFTSLKMNLSENLAIWASSSLKKKGKKMLPKSMYSSAWSSPLSYKPIEMD